MTEPRTFASLSSGLLARKGAAKPAMRPQSFGQLGMNIEDLGWNDMGYGSPLPEQEIEEPAGEHVPSSIAALTPAPRLHAEVEEVRSEPATPSPVIDQQRAIAAHFADPKAVKPRQSRRVAKSAAIVALPPQARQPRGGKAKTAFTLRLDAERHLRLRLACAVTQRSAQQIVTAALDDFLETLPELNAMARHMPAKFGTRS